MILGGQLIAFGKCGLPVMMDLETFETKEFNSSRRNLDRLQFIANLASKQWSAYFPPGSPVAPPKAGRALMLNELER